MFTLVGEPSFPYVTQITGEGALSQIYYLVEDSARTGTLSGIRKENRYESCV